MGNQVEYGIRINVDGSRDGAGAIDQVTASTAQLGTTAERTGQSLGAVNGQMNDTAAIMRKNAEAANTASEAAQKFLAPLQREIELFGASRAEVERYNAARAGLSATVQRQAATLANTIDAMRRDEEAARSLAASQDQATRAADAFLKKLNDQVATLGMNAQQLQTYRAAQLGVADAAAPMIAKLGEAGAGANSASKHMEGLNFQTVGAKRELLVLAHELSQGNFQKFGGSMMVLGEQTGAAGLLFSAAGLAALGLTAVLGGLAYAAIKGGIEQKHMNDALVMTGNYAGLTSDSLNALAHSAVAAGGSIGEAKKVATELAGSGKFTGDQIGYITSATVAWEHATGQSVKSIIKDFESLAVQTTGNSMRATEAISRATVKLDDQYHFLTEAVYEQIRALEKEGDAKGASALATESFARVTHDRAEEIVQNLGTIARGWNTVKETIGQAIDALGEFGQRSTPAIEVKKASNKLKEFDTEVTASNRRLGRPDDQLSEALAAARLKIVLELTDAVDELNKADAAGLAQGREKLAQSEGVHAASRIAADDAKLQKKGMTELQIALDQYAEDVKKVKAANPDSPLVTDEAVAAHVVAITKAHQVAVKGNDDRAKTLQDALLLEQTGLDRERSVYAARDKMLATYHTKFGLSDADFYAGREGARAEYIAAEAIAFAKESSLIQGFQPKNAQEVAANKVKYDQLLKTHMDFIDSMRNASGEDVINQLAATRAIQSASEDADNKYLSGLQAQADAIDVANGKQAKQASAVAETAAQQFRLAAAMMAVQAAEPVTDLHTQADVDQAVAMRATLLLQAQAQQKIADGLRSGEAAAASRKLADMAIRDWKDVGTSIADSLSSAFGAAGKSLGDMFKVFADNNAHQLQLTKELALASKLNDDDPQKMSQIAGVQRQIAQSTLKSYGDMAGAAKGFFKENSVGYRALEGAEKAYRAFEMATALEAMVVKSGLLAGYTGLFVASKATETAATVASVGPDVAASMTKGMAAAAVGVASQAQGDPYSAWVRMAAMAATMAALGFAVFGGSGGSGGGQTAAEVQKIQGSGSVFGDSSAKSDSIARAIALSASNSNIELNYTAGMLASLQAIESSMSGLANLVVRTTGVTDGSNMGIQTGTLSRTGGGANLAALGGVAGGVSSGVYLGSMVGSFLGPIGAVVGAGLGALAGAVVGKIVSLWGKTTQNIVDSGIQLGGSVRDLESGSGFQQYASVDTTKSSWFGLSKSTSNSVQTSGLDAGLSSQFGLVFKNLEGELTAAASGLGVKGEAVTKALETLVIAPSKVSLKGLSGDALTQAINNVIAKTMDDMAQAVFPDLDRFRKVGEGYAETVVRLSSDSLKLDGILGGIGKSFGSVGVQSLDARENLITLAGGIDALASKTQGFASNFLSQAEQLAPVQKYVTDQLAAMGLAGVQTREDFKQVVLGLDLTRPEAQATYASLMALQDAFAKTHAAAADLTKSESEIADERKDLQKQFDQLTMTSAQLRAKERATIDASNLALFDSVTNRQAADEATKALQTMFDSLRSNRDAALAFTHSLQMGSLSTLTPMQKYLEAQTHYEESLSKANASPADSAAQSAAQTAATEFLTASQTIYASSSAYVADRAKVLGDMSSLADLAGAQMSETQQQLSLAGQQVSGLTTLNTTALGIQQAIVNLGTYSGSGATVYDATQYTAPSTAGSEALVTEMRRLYTRLDDLVKVTEGRRSDAKVQANDQLDATETAAELICDSFGTDVVESHWRANNPQARKPR